MIVFLCIMFSLIALESVGHEPSSTVGYVSIAAIAISCIAGMVLLVLFG